MIDERVLVICGVEEVGGVFMEIEAEDVSVDITIDSA